MELTHDEARLFDALARASGFPALEVDLGRDDWRLLHVRATGHVTLRRSGTVAERRWDSLGEFLQAHKPAPPTVEELVEALRSLIDAWNIPYVEQCKRHRTAQKLLERM